MRAVRNTDSGPALVDVDEPNGDGALLDDRLLQRVRTDIGLVAMGSTGYTLGPRIRRTGRGRPRLRGGTEPVVRHVPECRSGQTQRCAGSHTNLGIFVDGGLCERIRVPAANLVAPTSGLDATDACLVEPGGGLARRGRAAVQPGSGSSW